MNSGIILIDKPAGISSAKVIAKARKALGIKKIGHAGTLDPMATGLIVALTNSATRLAQYAESGRKQYSGKILLGTRSDTDDITGELEQSEDTLPSFSDILNVKDRFVGDISQTPPKVSAVKVAGSRAYKRARRGEEFEIAGRQVSIEEFSLEPVSEREVSFRIRCSKGTYIRSIARDLGEIFGCGACLSELRREESFPFSVDQATPLEELTLDSINRWDILFPDSLRINLGSEQCQRMLNGDNGILSSLPSNDDDSIALYCNSESNKPLGLLKNSEDGWKIAVNIGRLEI